MCGKRVWKNNLKDLILLTFGHVAEEVSLTPNSLCGGLSRRARGCWKCAIKAFARRFAEPRRAETELLESSSGSNSGGESGGTEQKI